MIKLNPTPNDIADAAMRLHYDDITTDAALIDLTSIIDDPDRTFRDRLIDAIDLDLSDMLHNANLDFYATFTELNELTDANYDALADRLAANTCADLIADRLLALFPDTDFDA